MARGVLEGREWGMGLRFTQGQITIEMLVCGTDCVLVLLGAIYRSEAELTTLITGATGFLGNNVARLLVETRREGACFSACRKRCATVC